MIVNPGSCVHASTNKPGAVFLLDSAPLARAFVPAERLQNVVRALLSVLGDCEEQKIEWDNQIREVPVEPQGVGNNCALRVAGYVCGVMVCPPIK